MTLLKENDYGSAGMAGTSGEFQRFYDEHLDQLHVRSDLEKEEMPFLGTVLPCDPMLGSGKSFFAQQHVAELLEVKPDLRVVIFNTSQRLVTQTAVGLIEWIKDPSKVGKWRGQFWEGETGEPLCRMHVEAKAIQQTFGDPRRLCRFRTERCVHYQSCEYAAQVWPGRPMGREKVKQRDIPQVLVAPQAMTPHTMGPHANKHWDLAIWDDANQFHEKRVFKLDVIASALEDITPDRVVTANGADRLRKRARKNKSWNEERVNRELYMLGKGLNATANRVAKALRYAALSGARIRREELPGRDALKSLRNTLAYFVVDVPEDVRPRPEEKLGDQWIAAAAEAVAGLHSVINFLDMLHRALRTETESGLVLGLVIYRNDAGVAKIDIADLVRPHKSLRGEHIKHLSLCAFQKPLLLQSVFGQVDLHGYEDAPWQKYPYSENIRVRAEKGFVTNSLIRNGKPTRLFQSVLNFIHSRSRRSRTDDGRVTAFAGGQKAVSEMLRSKVDSNVAVSNTKAVDGINDYSEVRDVFIIGQSRPTPSMLHTIAEAYKREIIEIDENENWDMKEVIEVPLEGNPLGPLMVPFHRDEYLDAVFQMECFAGMIQLDRGRGSRRTVDRPLTTYFMNDLPSKQPIDRHISIEELAGWFLQMAVRFSIIPDLSLPTKPLNKFVSEVMPDLYGGTPGGFGKHRKRHPEEEAASPGFDNPLRCTFTHPNYGYAIHLIIDAPDLSAAQLLADHMMPGGDLELKDGDNA